MKDVLKRKRVSNADHVDLYDRKDKIPFDKLKTFFTEYLK
jgi:fermentation-respiration switch protein FrsA (DUF1100 family)